MRIVSWNCYRGECRSRAARLEALRPDIIVLQECGQPREADHQCVWFGDRPIQGVGVLSKGEWRVEPGPVDLTASTSVYPFRITGPTSFHLLAIWAQQEPTYVRAILAGLDHYRDFLKADPSVVIGDFNSHSRWNQRDGSVNHSALVRRLKDEFHLASAFHQFTAKSQPEMEPATLYWQWNQQQPFHVDYCFIPEAWASRLNSVEIGSFDEWRDSDHRPLVVNVSN